MGNEIGHSNEPRACSWRIPYSDRSGTLVGVQFDCDDDYLRGHVKIEAVEHIRIPIEHLEWLIDSLRRASLLLKDAE